MRGDLLDSFSHAFIGFVVGRGSLPKKYWTILVISCVILDVDSVSLIGGWETFLQFHRGPLHSLVGAVAVSLGMGIVYTKVKHLSQKEFVTVFLVCLGGCFGHIFLDLLTPWSIPVLWPFYNQKMVFTLTHFFDPVFFVTLLVASAVIFISHSKKAQIVMIAALFLVSMYFGVRFYGRESALDTVEAASDSVVFPTFRPDRWWVITKTLYENGYVYSVYNVDAFDKEVVSTKTIETPYLNCSPGIPPLDSPQKAVGYSKTDEQVAAFIEHARLPAVTVSRDGDVWEIFWFDVFSELSGGVSRGILVTIDRDGTILEIKNVSPFE